MHRRGEEGCSFKTCGRGRRIRSGKREGVRIRYVFCLIPRCCLDANPVRQLLKLEWSRLNQELRQAKESDIEGFVRIEDIENEPPAEQPEDIDAMMLDALEQEEQAELEALLASLPSQGSERTQTSQNRPESMHFSDDEDYDSLFMELISEQENVPPTNSDDVEMS
jgi:hypothetical protein